MPSPAKEAENAHCPTLDELWRVLESGQREHVIAIDDLSDFFYCGHVGFPAPERLIEALLKINPKYDICALDLRRGVLLAVPW